MSKTKNLFKLLSVFMLVLLSFALIACGESNADIAAKVDEIIEELPTEITLDDELVLIEAREAYEELTSDQKELVKNLADLEAKETMFENLEAAEFVITIIKGLPAELNLNHKELVTGARDSYDELTSDQKELVVNYEELEEAEETIAALEAEKAEKDAILNVENLISALPNLGALDVEDEDDVVAARAAYNDLTTDQKELVSNYSKLVRVEAELEELLLIKEREENKAIALVVDNMIANLPELDDLKLEDAEDVEAARAAYEDLTEEQKVFIINLFLLEDIEAKLLELAD